VDAPPPQRDRPTELHGMRVEFVGVDVQLLATCFACWEGLFQVLKRVVATSPHPKFAEGAHSYMISTVNCAMCTAFGGYYLAHLTLSGSPVVWAVFDESDPGAWMAAGVKHFAHYFLSWMAHDLLHMITYYPKLGHMDHVIHHSGFVCLCFLLMSYNLFPGAAAWLLFSEVSTLPLNTRWYLIALGKGDSKALTYVNQLFALFFFFSRVLLYWSGFAYLVGVSMPLVLAPPYLAPPPLVYLLVGAIGGGAMLNAYWLVKIYEMATRGGGPKEKKNKPE